MSETVRAAKILYITFLSTSIGCRAKAFFRVARGKYFCFCDGINYQLRSPTYEGLLDEFYGNTTATTRPVAQWGLPNGDVISSNAIYTSFDTGNMSGVFEVKHPTGNEYVGELVNGFKTGFGEQRYSNNKFYMHKTRVI